MQQESAAASVICLAGAGVKNINSTFLASADGKRGGKCHPANFTYSSGLFLHISPNQATLYKRVDINVFCTALEMTRAVSVLNNELAQATSRCARGQVGVMRQLGNIFAFPLEVHDLKHIVN